MSNLGNKEIMAKNIRRLMELNNVSRNQLCKDLGIKYTTFADWVNAKTYPRIDKIEKLAEYFGVKKSDLVEENNNMYYPKQSHGITNENTNSYYFNPEAAQLAQELYERPEMRILFDASRKATREDIEQVAAILEKLSKE